MKLWLIEATCTDGWDIFLGFVVRADDETAARNVASKYSYGDEGRGMWLDPSQARCECVGEGPGEAGVVLDSFKAG